MRRVGSTSWCARVIYDGRSALLTLEREWGSERYSMASAGLNPHTLTTCRDTALPKHEETRISCQGRYGQHGPAQNLSTTCVENLQSLTLLQPDQLPMAALDLALRQRIQKIIFHPRQTLGGTRWRHGPYYSSSEPCALEFRKNL